MQYYIRKSWEDKESQIGEKFTNLQDAVDNCKYGYTIFNRNGKALITLKDKYQKMWEKLKEYYLKELEDTNEREMVLERLSFSELLAKEYYTEFLKEMEKIENNYKGD